MATGTRHHCHISCPITLLFEITTAYLRNLWFLDQWKLVTLETRVQIPDLLTLSFSLSPYLQRLEVEHEEKGLKSCMCIVPIQGILHVHAHTNLHMTGTSALEAYPQTQWPQPAIGCGKTLLWGSKSGLAYLLPKDNCRNQCI